MAATPGNTAELELYHSTLLARRAWLLRQNSLYVVYCTIRTYMCLRYEGFVRPACGEAFCEKNLKCPEVAAQTTC
jgi:hypothetical protein